MRILYTNFHPRNGGGHATYVANLARSFQGEHQVTVTTPSTSRLFAQASRIPGVRCVDASFSTRPGPVYLVLMDDTPPHLQMWHDRLAGQGIAVITVDLRRRQRCVGPERSESKRSWQGVLATHQRLNVRADDRSACIADSAREQGSAPLP